MTASGLMYSQPGFGTWVLTSLIPNSGSGFVSKNSILSILKKQPIKILLLRSFVKEINYFYSEKEKLEIGFLLEFIKKTKIRKLNIAALFILAPASDWLSQFLDPVSFIHMSDPAF